MGKLTKSADVLIEEISSEVRAELFKAIEPIAKRLIEAVAELQKTLSSGKTTSAPAIGRRGPRRKPGRPAKVAMQSSAKVSGSRKRGPRGAFQSKVQSVMQRAGGPIKLSEIRDEIMRSAEFKKRDPKSLYTQIVQAIKKIPQVEKTAQGAYRIR